ncbi:MAG: hypothetical protein M0Z94_00760 [Dehalococcoidales bacterium]|nr:hypothetical protein [Dehalococcoidales bacterium]
MRKIRVQIGVDDPIEIPCATKAEAIKRAEGLVSMFRRAGSGRPPLQVHGSARRGSWTVEGLHDPIKVTVA